MLWSLLKMVVFFCIVAGLTLGAIYLLDFDAGLTISFQSIELNLGPLQAVILLVLLFLGFWLLLKLVGLLIASIRFLNGDETAISRYFDRNREKRGYQALNDALVALASGEGREAMREANKAERLLDKPELAGLLTAQAAEMSGDTKRAEGAYKALLTNDKTRFVGVRGILKQRLAEGDTETAMKLAEKAFALKPRHEETQDTLLRLQADKEDWAGARKTLAAKRSNGSLPRDVHQRRDAVLALSEAKDFLDGNDTIKAQEEFIEANRLSPDLVPAAVMAARTYIEKGNARYAARVVKKAWKASPHPDLAAAFAEIAPDETAQARVKRFGPLIKEHPSHPETKMLQAELLIAAEDFPAARRALGDLVESDPTARALTIMAAVERGEGSDDAVVRGWLTKALSASRGPQWVCDNCNGINAPWAPVCSNCGALDTLTWKTPSGQDVAMPSSTEMLPLIVGQPTPVTDAESADDTIATIDAEIVPETGASTDGEKTVN